MATKAQSKARREAYARKLRQIANRYDKLEAGEVRRQLAMLRTLRNSIAGELSDVSDFDKLRFKTLQKNIDGLIADYSSKAAASIELGVNGSHQQGSLYAIEPLEKVGIDTSWFKPSRAQVNVLTDMSADLITNVGEDVRKLAHNEIRMAALGGQTPFDAMKAITAKLGAPSKPTDRATGVAYRVEMITRTEMNRAFSLANFSGQQQAGEKIDGLQKKWMATGDGRTRAAHLSAHGQIKPVKEPFVVGGEKLMYPGDPTASGKQTINCRCRSVTVIPEVGDIPTPLDAQIEKERAKRKEEPEKVIEYIPMSERRAISDYQKWASNTAAADKKVIDDYRVSDYRRINSGLRTGDMSGIEGKVSTLDKILSQELLPRNAELYRGASIEALGGNEGLTIGRIITDKGYTSTSLSKNQAARFASFVEDENKTPVFITINAPKGTKAAYLESLGNIQGEQEMLLGRDGKYRIANVDKITQPVYGTDRDFVHVTLELVEDTQESLESTKEAKTAKRVSQTAPKWSDKYVWLEGDL